MPPILAAVLGLVVGAVVAWFLTRQTSVAQQAALGAERDLLRERVVDLEAAVAEDAQTAALLGPLRDTLGRVERQVTTLERDRVEQYGELASRLGEVSTTTLGLRQETAALAGALNSSTTRGTWGEVQLRRILEHAGMLARCDFDEQVRAVSRHDAAVRPDALVRLPGGKVLVIDSKAPLTAFLAAQTAAGDPDEHHRQLARHARQLRGHLDALAAKEYWTAFDHTPEMVVCFVPGDAILAAALQSDPELVERAMARKVVLASPSTLMAMLRTIAFTWQQETLTENARVLFDLGRDLHARLVTLGSHTHDLGSALRRSVESYNALVGSLESRVLVTARRMSELDLTHDELPAPATVQTAPRPLTAPELVESARLGHLHPAGPDQTRPTGSSGVSAAPHERGA